MSEMPGIDSAIDAAARVLATKAAFEYDRMSGVEQSSWRRYAKEVVDAWQEDKRRTAEENVPARPAPKIEAPSAESVARLFHETYERLAPGYGYKTRDASAKPWAEVPQNNRLLMTAVAGLVLDRVQREPALHLGDRVEVHEPHSIRMATVKVLGNATGPLVVVLDEAAPDTEAPTGREQLDVEYVHGVIAMAQVDWRRMTHREREVWSTESAYVASRVVRYDAADWYRTDIEAPTSCSCKDAEKTYRELSEHCDRLGADLATRDTELAEARAEVERLKVENGHSMVGGSRRGLLRVPQLERENTRLRAEVERLTGELGIGNEDAYSQAVEERDELRVVNALTRAARDAFRAEVERLTVERDKATRQRDSLARRCAVRFDETQDLQVQCERLRARAVSAEAERNQLKDRRDRLLALCNERDEKAGEAGQGPSRALSTAAIRKALTGAETGE